MTSNNKLIVIWLALVCLVIVAMIGVGGVTRLTHSGLSMVDWKPISGIVPPMNEIEWQAEFEQYKQFPEYQLVNRGISVDEFKSIFYWEYGHRVLGRLIGVIYFVPMLIFLLMGKVSRQLLPKLLVGLVLGGLQGLMGWYMVMSGLVDEPRVSHYRLAAHFSLALVILVYLYWLILELLDRQKETVPQLFRYLLILVLAMLSVQIVYGAFTAGLRAGLGFNTFPLMDGKLIADAALMMTPFYVNFFENGAMVQFVHRWLGTGLVVFVIALMVMAVAIGVRRRAMVMMSVFVGAVFVQFLLGVLTLLNYVPIGLGVAHQVFACVVTLSGVTALYHFRGEET